MMALYRGQCIGNWDLNGDGEDAGINNLDATPENMEWASGRFGQCGFFDGVDARLSLPNDSLLKPTSFTVMGYYRSTDSGNQTLIQNWTSYSSKFYGWACAFASGNTRMLVANGTGTVSGTNYTSLAGTTSVSDDALYFLAYTYNGGSKAMKLYVNGVLAGSATAVGLAYAATQYPNIGVREDTNGTYTYYLDGYASNITLLDYDATAEEIRRWFAWGRGLLC